MRDAIAAFLGALGGSAFSFFTVMIYIALVSRVARKVFQSSLIFLWFPVHILFALTFSAPMFCPFFALKFVGASFPLTNALYALAFSFGLLGLLAPLAYFLCQWRRLQTAGVLPPPKGLTKR